MATIIGTIGDVELRNTSSGDSMATFSIRESGRKDKEGNRPAFFWDCVAFGQLAENILALTEKGQRVIAHGRTDPQEWEKDGKTYRKVALVVNDLGLEVRFGLESGSGTAPQRREAASSPAVDEDVPF